MTLAIRLDAVGGIAGDMFAAAMVDATYVDSAQLVVIVCGREVLLGKHCGVHSETHSVWIV